MVAIYHIKSHHKKAMNVSLCDRHLSDTNIDEGEIDVVQKITKGLFTSVVNC